MFLCAMSFNIAVANDLVKLNNAKDVPFVKKWKVQTCPDGSTFEICLYSGDGNKCDEYLGTTRDCVPSTVK